MPISERESLKSLAFLYLTFGHSTDGALSIDEMRALASRLQQRAPEADLDRVAEVIKSAVNEYKTLPTMSEKLARAQEHTSTLRAQATADEVQGVLDDLRQIAGADGNISPEEEKFIADVAAALA